MSDAPKPYTPLQEKIGHWVIKPMTDLNIWVYRKSGGRLMGTFPGGAPIVLLTTTGRRSGRQRTVALIYYREGERFYVVGSKGGMSTHPAWVHNLEADPSATIQLGRRRQSVRATRLSDDRKIAVWPRLIEIYPDYETYQQRTRRNIRVYALDPA